MKDRKYYTSTENLEKYIKECCTFDFAKNKSEEFYFGENNPLKTRLIANISHIREVAKNVYAKNRFAKPIDVLQEIKLVQNELIQTIIEEFNIEGCVIGWYNETNASCFCQWGNADLFGKSKDADDLNKRMNDIITSDSNGFHYRDKKGIYYCILLGYNVFAIDNLFTVEEAAAMITHELGHAMQHMINSVNQCTSLAQFQYLLTEIVPDIDNLPYETKKYVISFIKRYKEAKRKNDKNTLDLLGKELLEVMSEETGDGFSYSNITNDELEAKERSNWNVETYKDEEKRIKNPKRKSFFKALTSSLKAILGGTFGSIFLISSMFNMNRLLKNKNKDIHACKLFEEAADNFCSIYGLGPQLASCMKKINDLGESYKRTVPRVFERIPLLDLTTSIKELRLDYQACVAGYPTNKQRAINLYKAADFELKHNKDLSEDAKKELQKQIDEYKRIYEEFVNNDKSKGFFYKIFAGIKRETLEEAAKKDKLVDEHILIPLQQKADPKFNPDDALKD